MRSFLKILGLALLLSACGNGDIPNNPTVENPDENTVVAPANIGYQVINTYPHDTAAFIEGLQYVDGKMLESTGLNGQSDLRRYELETGKIINRIALDNKYFGEGCTQLKGKIYQLTYQEKTCFVYDAVTFKKLKEFNYSFGEGWGLTNDGEHLIIGTGGSNLFFYDPETFKEIKRIGVTNQYGPVANINELEFIKGFIYANVWQRDIILKIDPNSGRVVGEINLADLRGKSGLQQLDELGTNVLNGIAYDSTANRIFITGKNWPKIFEVKFDN